MVDTSDEAVLTAIDNSEKLFDTLEGLVSSNNYIRVLSEIEPDKTQGDISDQTGLAAGTVSNAVNELIDVGLVEEVDDGYKSNLQVVSHPLIKELYKERDS